MCGRADSDDEQPAPHHLQVGNGFGGQSCALPSREPEEELRKGGDFLLLFEFFCILLKMFPPRVYIYDENVKQKLKIQKIITEDQKIYFKSWSFLLLSPK